MPQLEPGSTHSATVTFSNPKPAGFDYSASLCMGADWAEMATANFHLEGGQSKAVVFPVTMPTAEGTYPIYFKVSSGGVLIGTFVATEDVTIVSGAMHFTLEGINWRRTVNQWNPEVSYMQYITNGAGGRNADILEGHGWHDPSTILHMSIPYDDWYGYPQVTQYGYPDVSINIWIGFTDRYSQNVRAYWIPLSEGARIVYDDSREIVTVY